MSSRFFWSAENLKLVERLHQKDFDLTKLKLLLDMNGNTNQFIEKAFEALVFQLTAPDWKLAEDDGEIALRAIKMIFPEGA